MLIFLNCLHSFQTLIISYVLEFVVKMCICGALIDIILIYTVSVCKVWEELSYL